VHKELYNRVDTIEEYITIGILMFIIQEIFAKVIYNPSSHPSLGIIYFDLLSNYSVGL